MATVPLSGSDVRLISNVPFYKDYKHSRWFESRDEQTAYFTSKNIVRRMPTANFVRIEGKQYISVNASIDELWGTNYLMFQNAQYNSKWFYAFVTKLEYRQTKTTYVHFEIDVLQTWMFDMKFKPSFVIREHGKLWNADGTPIINTLDEGLDYGTDYDTVSVQKYTPNNGFRWLVIISKSEADNSFNDVKAVSNGIPQPLSYYLIPFQGTNTAAKAIWHSSGQTDPLIPSSPLQAMNALYKIQEAVNNIVSIFITEHPGFSADYGSDGVVTIPGALNHRFSEAAIGDTAGEAIRCLQVEYVGAYNAEEITHLTDKYSPYPSVKESKLLMYPYSLTVIDDFKGNRLEVKNEYISGKELKTLFKGSLGTSNKTSLAVANYNRTVNSHSLATAQETALINTNPQDVAVVTDHLAAFLQGNRNSIENQRSSIMWNGILNGLGGVTGGVAAAAGGNITGAAASGLGVVQGAGNTALQIQGIEAKQQDISNVPPTLAKMGSNIAYDYGNSYNGFYIIHKMIKPEYRRKLTDFFNMFGYKVNEVKKPYFHSRRYWNYIQTASCVITGNFNNEDLVELKAIFDNGITLWHTDDVGNYDLNNEVII